MSGCQVSFNAFFSVTCYLYLPFLPYLIGRMVDTLRGSGEACPVVVRFYICALHPVVAWREAGDLWILCPIVVSGAER